MVVKQGFSAVWLKSKVMLDFVTALGKFEGMFQFFKTP